MRRSSSFVGMRCYFVLLLEGEAMPCLPALGRGAALFLCRKMRPYLVFLRCDKAMPRSLTSSSFAGTRCCLVLQMEGEAWTRRRLVFLHYDEAAPCSPTRRRGVASSSFVGMRRCLVLLLEGEAHLVFQRWDEVLPHSYAGVASFFCRKARRRLVFQRWDKAPPHLPPLGQGRYLVLPELG
ncbi:hypothetical protein BHE74_00051948 [Ensete ventricosum]|nr:hypothetical protein BHE74_00051948 [Ensete ventricosum]RZS17761.1 hypothetical protein BHM03_00049951 [Ensete ventricosum]